MRKAGFLGIIHIDLDFGGTDLANGTKDSDDVHRKAECSIEDDPPALGGYRGEKRAFWQFGRPTIWSRCRSWRSDCVQKYGDVESTTIPSLRSLET